MHFPRLDFTISCGSLREKDALTGLRRHMGRRAVLIEGNGRANPVAPYSAVAFTPLEASIKVRIGLEGNDMRQVPLAGSWSRVDPHAQRSIMSSYI